MKELILAAAISICVPNGLLCLSCGSVSQPRYCHEVEDCKPDQLCTAKTYRDKFGDTYYNIGCTDKLYKRKIVGLSGLKGKQTAPKGRFLFYEMLCKPARCRLSECCQGDMCNSKLCGATGYPNTTGPICYNCTSLPKTRTCRWIDNCREDEVCFIQETEEFGDVLVTSGCKTSLGCHAMSTSHVGQATVVGKRSISVRTWAKVQCQHCCDKQLCNNLCGQDQNHYHIRGNTTS